MLDIFYTNDMNLNMADSYPRCGDAFWSGLPEEKKEKLIRSGEKYLQWNWPALPATAFISIVRDGNRKRYEDIYFSRREALTRLVLAECAEDKGRFLDDIMNGIFCICEESGWVIPAHNSYIRDTPQLPLPISDRPVLDLFACETGAILACVHFLLGERLKTVAEEIPLRIERELKRRIIEPYLHEFFWFMGNDRERTNNWTVWCTQNVLLAAFLLPHSQDTWHAVMRQAIRSTDCFIREYGDDGGCPEGASYYHHAALCLFECIDILNGVSGNAFAAVYRQEKIRNIASYIMKVHVSGEYFLNYADCDIKSGLAGIREYRFAKATMQEDMMQFASSQLNLKKRLYGLDYEGRSLCEMLENLLWEDEALAFSADRDAEAAAKETGFRRLVSLPSVGIHAAEGRDLYLSVKSGSNCGSHKHNDVGSYIVFAKGEPLLIDVGVEVYSQKTFSSRRYEIWTMQSGYHNLPTICGHEQVGNLQDLPGKYEARDVRAVTETLSDGTERFTEEMELKYTYDEDTPIRSYRRFWSFEPEGEIQVRDVIDFSGDERSWTLNFMTEAKPEYREADRQLVIGNRGYLHFEGSCRVETEEIPITDQRLLRNWKNVVYRTRVTPEEASFTCRVGALSAPEEK